MDTRAKVLKILCARERIERFAWYYLIALFMLFMIDSGHSKEAGRYYGILNGLCYALPILGGYIADKYLGYKLSITIGLGILALGYTFIGIPTNACLLLAIFILLPIGNGLFKPNMQTLVGNLYGNTKEEQVLKRKAYFQYYMAIN